MKILSHLRTINKHRRKVRKFCFKCGLYKQGLLHDLSKYSFCEFFNGVKYFSGKYSPHFNERQAKGYSSAWLHHKGRNKHHSEYWLDQDKITKEYVPIKMPDRYVGEMICDRIAASMIYNKKNYTTNMPLDYFLNERDRVIMHEDTKELVYKLLLMYQEKGQKETFKYIKKNLRNNKVTY